MPGLKRCLSSSAAKSNAGSSCSEQRISWRARSRDSGIPSRSSSAFELDGDCRVQIVWLTLTLPKSYIRFGLTLILFESVVNIQDVIKLGRQRLSGGDAQNLVISQSLSVFYGRNSHRIPEGDGQLCHRSYRYHR